MQAACNGGTDESAYGRAADDRTRWPRPSFPMIAAMMRIAAASGLIAALAHAQAAERVAAPSCTGSHLFSQRSGCMGVQQSCLHAKPHGPIAIFRSAACMTGRRSHAAADRGYLNCSIASPAATSFLADTGDLHRCNRMSGRSCQMIRISKSPGPFEQRPQLRQTTPCTGLASTANGALRHLSAIAGRKMASRGGGREPAFDPATGEIRLARQGRRSNRLDLSRSRLASGRPYRPALPSRAPGTKGPRSVRTAKPTGRLSPALHQSEPSGQASRKLLKFFPIHCFAKLRRRAKSEGPPAGGRRDASSCCFRIAARTPPSSL